MELKTSIRRLRTLERHLRKSQREMKAHRFHFGVWFDKNESCGTIACAGGEWALLNPKRWVVKGRPGVIALRGTRLEATRALSRDFGISTRAVEHMFMPNQQNPQIYGGLFLNYPPIHKEIVADQIAEYVRRLEAGEITRDA